MDARAELEQLRKLKRLRELEAKAAPEKTYDPTEGMSGTEKFFAGMGKGMVDIGRGVGQLTGMVSQEDIDEAKRLDAPLAKTGAGKTGEIAGKVLTALPTAFIPGANTLVGSMVIGGGLGALEPTATGESRAANIMLGGAGGAGGQLIGRAIPRVAKAAIEPFTKRGQERIAGRTIAQFAGDKADDVINALKNPEVLVPGSMPTAAEAAMKAGGKGAGIAQLQRAAQSSSPQLASDFSERALEQNAARIAALTGVTGTADDLTAAMASRSGAGKDLYDKAFRQTVRVDDSLKKLTQRPSMQAAIERAAKIAEEEGVPLKNLFDKTGKTASVRGLHYVKMALDDMLDDVTGGIGKTEKRAITSTKNELVGWLDKANPAYSQARKAFAEASVPINRMEVGQEILKRSTGSQLPNVRGDFTLYPSSYGSALKNAEQIAKRTTGFGKGLEETFSPEQLATLNAIRSDLARGQSAQNMGRAVGSNTAQNLASQNLLRRTLGTLGAPESLAENTILRTVARPYQFISQMGEPKIQDALARALLDPQEAARLMATAEGTPFAKMLSDILSRTAVAGGTGLALGAQ